MFFLLSFQAEINDQQNDAKTSHDVDDEANEDKERSDQLEAKQGEAAAAFFGCRDFDSSKTSQRVPKIPIDEKAKECLVTYAFRLGLNARASIHNPKYPSTQGQSPRAP